MKSFRRVIFFFITIQSLNLFAHGEDKPGPNGGFIRMPGAFHTEIVPIDARNLKVFLLDINWKNPSVQGSSLKMTHKGTGLVETCKVETNYYICSFPKKVDLTKKSELFVEAKREEQVGAVVSYDLPLKFKKVDDGHAGHH